MDLEKVLRVAVVGELKDVIPDDLFVGSDDCQTRLRRERAALLPIQSDESI